MEHIEEAGIHSGDSTCVLPPHTLAPTLIEEIKRATTRSMALELGVVGLMNVQFAVKGDEVYVLEVNPRASRTVPFVSKAIGVPLAKLAAKVMAGKTLEELGFTEEVMPPSTSRSRSRSSRSTSSPASTSSSGPRCARPARSWASTATSASPSSRPSRPPACSLPKRGQVFISVKNSDKRAILAEARELARLGYELLATEGTWRVLKSGGVPVERVNKLHEGRPHIVDRIKNREIDLVLNTPLGKQEREDDDKIRATAVQNGVTCITTVAGISAVVQALAAIHRGDYDVRKLQEYHAMLPSAVPARA